MQNQYYFKMTSYLSKNLQRYEKAFNTINMIVNVTVYCAGDELDIKAKTCKQNKRNVHYFVFSYSTYHNTLQFSLRPSLYRLL